MIADLPRYRVLGVPFNPIDFETTIDECLRAVSSDRFHLLVTLGTEMVMSAQTDHQFLAAVEGADLVVPDGVGLVFASRLAGLKAPERVTGVDLVGDLVARCDQGTRFFFYGSAPGVAQKAVANLEMERGEFTCVGTVDGYVEDRELVLQTIEALRPQVLFVALGFPRQENFLTDNKDRLERAGVRLGIGVGGSFDAYAGTVERAPTWIQRIHLEWLYRVLTQPSRWKRSLALPRFAFKVLSGPKRAVQVDS